jgi:hypothetical protein
MKAGAKNEKCSFMPQLSSVVQLRRFLAGKSAVFHR